MSDQNSTELANRAFAVRPVLTTWALTIGVDLFFNAGLFLPLFDQAREPSLLSDEQLFRRIPVAYSALLIGVTALAWIFDRLAIAEVRRGVVVGSFAGTILSLMGVVYLWTAIEMTAIFVAAASLVVMVEFASAGWALSAFRVTTVPAGLTRRILSMALLASVTGIVIQNLQS